MYHEHTMPSITAPTQVRFAHGQPPNKNVKHFCSIFIFEPSNEDSVFMLTSENGHKPYLRKFKDRNTGRRSFSSVD